MNTAARRNSTASIRARIHGRKEADNVIEFVLGEIDTLKAEGGDWGEVVAAAFIKRFGERWNERFPPPKPKEKPPQPAVDDGPVVDVDESVFHRVDLDGHCRRHTTAAALFESHDGRTFWVPLKCIKCDVPGVDDYVQFIDVPGWKVNEAGIQDLVYE